MELDSRRTSSQNIAFEIEYVEIHFIVIILVTVQINPLSYWSLWEKDSASALIKTM